jgi:hypothetical protein
LLLIKNQLGRQFFFSFIIADEPFSASADDFFFFPLTLNGNSQALNIGPTYVLVVVDFRSLLGLINFPSSGFPNSWYSTVNQGLRYFTPMSKSDLVGRFFLVAHANCTELLYRDI